LGSPNAGIDAVAPLFLQKIKIIVLQLTTSCCYRLVTYFGRGTRLESKLSFIESRIKFLYAKLRT
jgi:hypothetical protein